MLWGITQVTQVTSEEITVFPTVISGIRGSAAEAVVDGFPLRGVGRRIDRDPAVISRHRPGGELRRARRHSRRRRQAFGSFGQTPATADAGAGDRFPGLGRAISRPSPTIEGCAGCSGAGAFRARDGLRLGLRLDLGRRGDWPDHRFQFRPRNSAGTKQDRSRVG